MATENALPTLNSSSPIKTSTPVMDTSFRVDLIYVTMPRSTFSRKKLKAILKVPGVCSLAMRFQVSISTLKK
ncbi:hypothetical protein D3C76_1802950 [compost metagenome]